MMTEKKLSYTILVRICNELMEKHAKNWRHWDEVCKEEVIKAMIELYNTPK